MENPPHLHNNGVKTDHSYSLPDVFLACGVNFRCWPQADVSSAVGGSHDKNRKPALEKSLAPRVRRAPLSWEILVGYAILAWTSNSKQEAI